MPANFGHRVLPCLLVSDMRRSLEFYVETLRFVQTGYYPIASEPNFTEVRRDDVAIILFTEPIHGREQLPTFSGALYLFPPAIDHIADELRGMVPFAWGPNVTEFGLREFAIRDPDGYTIVFAERSSPHTHGEVLKSSDANV
ncbi:MAG TPA: VOC family protein [Lacipirellulaceae bacterium]|jgi:catechol 2,3-dioxygenase-like lactoylglutathione lyase family enzyme|nr:VOC family protein [Lacipirellulaceae bacterium]